MNIEKIKDAIPPHLAAKIAKMALARKLTLAEMIVFCLKGETTQAKRNQEA